MADDAGPAGRRTDALDDAQQLAARRLQEYVDVWEHAVQRLADGEYHSEDLVDDSFALWGKWVRDGTAAAALAWRMAAPSTPPPGGPDDGR